MSNAQVSGFRPHWLAVVGAVFPVVATHAALALNLAVPPPDGLVQEFRCIPYWDGCVSISRAVRSGPGLLVFRAVMLPTAAVLFLTWWLASRWVALLRPGSARYARRIGLTGMTGALFLVLYVGWLGAEGEFYGWLRRYGVTFYFGLTALAQLLLVHALSPLRRDVARPSLALPLRALFALVGVQWLGGVVSVAKRALLADPELMDRVENVIEWWFALALSAAFLAIAAGMRRSGYRLDGRVDPPAGGNAQPRQ